MVVVCGSGDGVYVLGVCMRKWGGFGDQTEKKSVSSGNVGHLGWVGRPVVGRLVPGRNFGHGKNG